MLENINFGNRSSTVDILKKLLTGKDIEMKTHLSIEQIQVLTQLKWFALNELYPEQEPFYNLSLALDYYLRLMTSLDRKSREEVIEAISEMKKPENADSPVIKELTKK